MVIPYGFGVSDFIDVGKLAWNVYKSCMYEPHKGRQHAKQWAGKAAPESFGNISSEVLSLHAVLKECKETLFTRPLPPEKAERLQVIKEGCDKVLIDLQNLVEKYKSLGTQRRNTGDRMRWANEDIAQIRARLTSNIGFLNVFISTSQISVEAKLDKFMQEFHQGKKEGSTVSLQSVDSLSAYDRAVWRTIRKDLEKIGISVAAFDANRNFILDWFVRAVETGAFGEQDDHGTDVISNCSDEQDVGNDERSSQMIDRHIEHTRSESPGSISENNSIIRPPSSESVANAEHNDPQPGPVILEHDSRTTPKERIRILQVAALRAGVSRPRRRLLKAIETKDVSKALKILKDEASFRLLDTETLNKALWSASRQVGGAEPRLITELIARGGNVNYISSDPRERTPLWNSVANGSLESVRIFVENGADVNYTGSERIYEDQTRGGTYDFAPRATLTGDVAILRLLLSSGVDVNTQYETRGHGNIRDYCKNSKISLIHEATSIGAVAAIEKLLDFRADIDGVSPKHGTALMLALSIGQGDAARLLLTKGADPSFRTSSLEDLDPTPNRALYKSPIEAAIIGGDVSLLKILLDHGAVPDDSTLGFSKTVAGLRNRSHEILDREIQRCLNTKDLSPSPEMSGPA